MLGAHVFRDACTYPVDQVPSHISKTISCTEEAKFLCSCEGDIKKLASYWVKRLGLPEVDADDLYQDTQMQLLCLFRSQLHVDEGSLKKLISRLIFNKARVYRRAHDRYGSLTVEPVEERDSLEDLDPILTRAVHRTIHALPADLQKVYDLIYRRGLSQSQVAARLSVSQPRVSQLNRTLLSTAAGRLFWLTKAQANRSAKDGN
jgi:RNA polymerase sigma factor (sigma-70 family)